MINAAQIAQALGKATPKTGGGFMCCCPAHADKNPSLSIDDSDTGGVLVKCWAGCTQDAVIDALKSRELWPVKEPSPLVKSKVVARYDYHGPDGSLLYWKERIEPGREGRSKEFKFYHGNRQTKRGGDAVLYHMPDVLQSSEVIICEGERKADIVKAWELIGTSLDSGANSGITPSMIEALTGKHIVILPDNDEPGRGYAGKICAALSGKAASIRIVNLPGLSEKGDIVDWIKTTGNDKEHFLNLLDKAPEWSPQNATGEASGFEYIEEAAPARIQIIDAFDFMAMKFPPRENIFSPWLPRQGLTMVYAPRGVGKTHVSLGIGYAVTSAGSFLGWHAETPRNVLFIDGEMPAVVLQERIARIAASNDKEPAAKFRIYTPDMQPNGMINLSCPNDQAALEPFLKDIDLIILDNLSTLCRSGRENEGEAWLPVQQWALQQRAAGRSVLFIHHAGKNGEQRGSSRREDVLDTVISLKRPSDYTPDLGACFEAHFEKARGLFGEDTKPFEARLMTAADGTQTWAMQPLENSTAEKVAALLNEGIPQSEIAELLNLSKGAVSKAKTKAAGMGLLKAVS